MDKNNTKIEMLGWDSKHLRCQSCAMTFAIRMERECFIEFCPVCSGQLEELNPPVPNAEVKKPVLFYYEDAENCWTPAPRLVEEIISTESLAVGDGASIEFKVVSMTDAELAALPEI